MSEALTIKHYEGWLERAKEKKDTEAISRLGKQIEMLKKIVPCSNCGSEEFFMAPIVNIRCYKCRQPL
jgi:hypothetical protein